MSLDLKALFQRGEAVVAWERANPDLARAWNAAIREDEERDARKKHRLEQAARRDDHLRRCGASEDAIAAIAGGFRLGETPALAAARRFVKAPEAFLLLAGDPGTGKTAAATMLLLQARRHGWCATCRLVGSSYDSDAGRIVRAPDLARASVYGAEADAAWRGLATVAWLIIDELGTEPMPEKGMWLGMLDALIDARWRDKRKTVLTTNLDTKSFAARYGARIVDRIVGAGMVVGCGTKSLRRRG